MQSTCDADERLMMLLFSSCLVVSQRSNLLIILIFFLIKPLQLVYCSYPGYTSSFYHGGRHEIVYLDGVYKVLKYATKGHTS